MRLACPVVTPPLRNAMSTAARQRTSRIGRSIRMYGCIHPLAADCHLISRKKPRFAQGDKSLNMCMRPALSLPRTLLMLPPPGLGAFRTSPADSG
ncbi:hypothetical protein B0H12DRAFT_1149223, partial [Mycena haematopus]